jgi:glucose/arabinose dehydrogenase
MSERKLRWSSAIAAAIAVTTAVSAPAAQHTQPAAAPNAPAAPIAREGYREGIAYEGRVTIKTNKGPKTLNLVVKKLMIDNRQKNVKLVLPAKGTVILQHRAGEVEIAIGDKRRAPLEGERFTINLPQSVVVTTRDDAVLIDAIVISE